MIRLLNKMDKVLLVLTIFMFLFGLFMILDASSMRSFLEYGVNTKYFTKQLIILCVCLFVSIIIISTPLKRYTKTIYFFVFGLFGVLCALFTYGSTINSSRSWFQIPGLGSFQPSELAKVVLILFYAVYYYVNRKQLDNLKIVLVPLAVSFVFAGLTFMQPDGGTGLILVGISGMMFYAVPISNEIKIKVTFFGLTFIVLAMFMFMITGHSPLSKMQQGRFNYLNPCTRYRQDTGYQVCNGYIAINNGKIFSIEPGNSKQKYLYLPEAHTDFIFPIVVEEMGLVTGIFIILVYMLIIYRILLIARMACNLRNSIICYGSACYIFLHVVINLTGILGIMPLTGVPLPFLSYGGSFALTLTIALSLVQRAAIENYNFRKKIVLK